MGTCLLAGVCLAVVPSINKSCRNTELPWRTHALSYCKRWDKGKGRGSAGAEVIAMGFDMLPLLRMRRHCYHVDFVEVLKTFEALYGKSPMHEG